MPQGGIDPGRGADRRRLARAVGRDRGAAADSGRADRRRRPANSTYDLPEDLVGKVWKGNGGASGSAGSCSLPGEDADVDIQTAEPEFRAWRWAAPAGPSGLSSCPSSARSMKELLTVFGQHLVSIPCPSFAPITAIRTRSMRALLLALPLLPRQRAGR